MEIETKQINNEVPPTVENKKSSKKLLPFLIFFLVFLCLGLVYVFFFQKDSVFEKGELEKDAEKLDYDILQGEIFLTLSPLGEEKSNIYKLDLESMELEEYFENTPYRNYTSKFSPNLEEMVFVRVYDDDTNQLLIFNEVTEEIRELTESSTLFPRNPLFSPDGTKVAYWVYEDSVEPFGFSEKPEDNAIYTVSLSNNEKSYVTNGAYPLFSPDGKFLLFLKNDGLYTIDLDSEIETLVFQLDFAGINDWYEEEGLEPELWTWLTLRFNFCPRNNILIITDTLGFVTMVLEVESWSPFVYESLFEVETHGPNWPVFSPFGNYIVKQEFGYDDPGMPQLSFFGFNIEDDYDYYGSVSLDGFLEDFIWITDWVIR